MTDKSLLDGIAGLGVTIERFGEVVEKQASNAEVLAVKVEESNARSVQMRKALRRLSFLMLAKLVTLVLLGFLMLQVIGLAHTIKDCTSPSGACAKRNAALGSQFIASMAYRSERERITTEIPIAVTKGDTVRVDELNKRAADLDASIAATDKSLAQIQQQQREAKK